MVTTKDIGKRVVLLNGLNTAGILLDIGTRNGITRAFVQIGTTVVRPVVSLVSVSR